jgi:hypothetical protein
MEKSIKPVLPKLDLVPGILIGITMGGYFCFIDPLYKYLSFVLVVRVTF